MRWDWRVESGRETEQDWGQGMSVPAEAGEVASSLTTWRGSGRGKARDGRRTVTWVLMHDLK